MSDGEILLITFSILYFAECLRWIPASGQVCICGGSGRWRLRGPVSSLQGHGWGFVVLPLLPPFGPHFVASRRPLALLEGKSGRKALDVKETARKAAAMQSRLRPVHALAGALFLWCFGLVPLVYRWLGESLWLWIAVAVLLVMQAIQAALFLRASRPEALGFALPHRRWKALAIALLPQFSIRAGDAVCKCWPLEPHPLALRLLMREDEWCRLAAESWRQEKYQGSQGAGKELSAQAEALIRFFKAQGIDPAAFELPPPRDSASLAYCPRCLTQFTRADGSCADCGGVPLRPFHA